MNIAKFHCSHCDIGIEGHFRSSPLSQLSGDHQHFIELFVLSSGSLKKMAETLGITYPTVRNRLDEVIESLQKEMHAKEDYKDELLGKVETGELTPEAASKILKDI